MTPSDREAAWAEFPAIFDDFDAALATLNSVLNKDSNHFLSLLRRSQVYKKVNLRPRRKISSDAHSKI